VDIYCIYIHKDCHNISDECEASAKNPWGFNCWASFEWVGKLLSFFFPATLLILGEFL
jgi:hypothetical protein